jgi:hypothetical protein
MNNQQYCTSLLLVMTVQRSSREREQTMQFNSDVICEHDDRSNQTIDRLLADSFAIVRTLNQLTIKTSLGSYCKRLRRQQAVAQLESASQH